MAIDQIANMQSLMAKPNYRASLETSPAEAQQSFKTWLNEAVEGVNNTRIDSENMTQAMARGEQVDLHEVMISAQKASITLETTIEVRNKVIEAYQEIMRMQV